MKKNILVGFMSISMFLWFILPGNVNAQATLPENLAVTNANTLKPTFTWTAVTGATGYNLQIFINATCTGTPSINNATLTTNSYTPAADLAVIRNKTVCWQVRSKTGTVYAAFVKALTTFLGANPPTVPVLSTTIPPVLTATTSPELKWTASTVTPAAGITYSLQIDDNADFSSPTMGAVDIPGISITSPGALLNATTYYFRVRSKNPNDNSLSAWSAGRSFKVAYAAPNLIVSAVNPLILRSKFDWSDVTGTGMTGYNLQASVSSTMATPFINATVLLANGSEYTPTTDIVPKNKIIYWRVRVNGTYGPGPWSQVASYTSANPPSVPVLSATIPPAVSNSMNPTFQWTASVAVPAVTGITYNLQIDDNTDFSSPFVDALDISGISVASPRQLANGATYYFRVRSKNPTGGFYSNWSATRNFKISYIANEELAVVPVIGTYGYCQGITVSGANLSSGNNLTVTSTANRSDIKTFSYRFFNLDNLDAAKNPKPIMFVATKPYTWTVDKTITSASNTITLDFSRFDRNDTNWLYYMPKPKNVLVRAYFTDTTGKTSKTDVLCETKIKVQSVDPTPTPQATCTCGATGLCATTCFYDKFTTPVGFTYSSPRKCNLSSSLFTSVPTQDQKNAWCRSYYKSKGDANGDGKANLMDYFYYISSRVGQKVPPTVNVDFDGDGFVTETFDRAVIMQSLK